MPATRPFRAPLIGLAALAGLWLLSASGDEFNLAPDEPQTEFHFNRLVFNSVTRGGDYWAVDYPDAEYHFLQGITRLTRVEADDRSRRMYSITNDSIFDYPWLYAVEVGYWHLNDHEAERLREYLLRGGFLMVDDFHGTAEWRRFTEGLQRVFPDRPIVDIPEADPVMHVLYDLHKDVQIYGIRPLMMGMTYEYDGYDPQWKGVYDDDGRLMVAINHNMDLGDAWEHADTPAYPEPLTALAYRYAVNYVIYAMTH